MRSLDRALAALALAALAAAAIVTALVATGDRSDAPLDVNLGPLVGVAFAGTGLYAWRRRPDSRFGALMAAVGLAWLVRSLQAVDDPELHIAGLLADTLPYALLVHMLVAFPDGRAEGWFERALVGLAYSVTTVVHFASIAFYDTTREECGCPRNPILIERNDSLADGVALAASGLGAVGLAGLIVLLTRRWRRAADPQRHGLAPVLAIGAVLCAALLVTLVADLTGFPDDAGEDAIDLMSLVVLTCIPFAFLAGLLRSRLSRDAAVRALIERLGAEREQRGGLRDALAEALGDPTLELAYWLPEQGAYADVAGRPVALPGPGSERAWAAVERDGRPVAAIVHDRSLCDEPDLVRSAGAAAALALDNERLAAELRARIEELRASRARLVDTADAERRRIERDLHDGAQQRLVALALGLRLARSKLDADPAAAAAMLEGAQDELAAATDELRELARGIHPPLLSDRGLDAAIDALASRSQVPVEVESMPTQRLPAPVEAAAYFVVAEALTNVARYSEASGATVRVVRENGRVAVEVADDGVGGADPDRGSGLRGLADRVATLDGRLDVRSPAGAGTTVRAEIPCG
jgi:signal transduction histidine kinase